MSKYSPAVRQAWLESADALCWPSPYTPLDAQRAFDADMTPAEFATIVRRRDGDEQVYEAERFDARHEPQGD